MNEEKDNLDIPALDKLKARYRDTSAPPGFAARVAALQQEESRRSWWRATPMWVGASVAAAVLVAVLVLPLMLDGTLPTDDAPGGETPQIAALRPAQAGDVLSGAEIDFNTAQLSEAADWLAAQEPLEMPDISDLPSPWG